MCVWDGWVPHCVSVCMYEICTEGFIVQPGEEHRIWVKRKTDYGTYVDFSFSRVIWDHVTYSEASAMSLKNATLLAQEFLTACSRGTDNRDVLDIWVAGVQS